MFEWVGANALDGLEAHFKEQLSKLNPQDAVVFIEQFPVIKQLFDAKTVAGQLATDAWAGYMKMTPDERATFMMNLELAGAALAAKTA